MTFLVYTENQHRKLQLLLCYPALTLNYAVHVKLGLGIPEANDPDLSHVAGQDGHRLDAHFDQPHG